MIRVLVVVIAVVFGAFFVISQGKGVGLVSPIGKVYGTAKVEVVNSWFPKEKFNVWDTTSLNISAKSAIAVNAQTGEIIFNKNSKEKLPVASTVKIMTALVALENADPSALYTVSEKAAAVGENSMGLTVGEKLTLGELLYGLMLVSGNDAAVTVAEGVSGSEGAFVTKMNGMVVALGLGDTKFVNASGLDEDSGNGYSTAYDMAVISHYVWQKYELFRKISSTYNEYIDYTPEHKAFDLYNDTNLLTTYPGVRGIKPGFTWEAGLCLVTYAENDGKKIIAVILGSDDRRGEMKELLDYSFGTYGIRVSHPGLDL
ncbi:MAG: D-alanyl-D-alanine carboxypeptidase family protein [Candidatus Curtissbacteria bacterium]|nr:D-alanyl-D-alanine carboxypeptidase family protein [Candidatus Curtissbacteria bacterium]